MDDKEKNQKSETAVREERVLEFWEEKKIFEKSLKQREGKKEFIFYEGPPTANGKPGIHHLEARAFKDAIPRYKTMRGYHVRRKGGWDTHGLPVELQVEKKLGLNSKKAIEEYGIAKFNHECKESVWEYLDTWNKFTKRTGYWLDQQNPYITYENKYIESVWNVLKTADDQELLYKDYKVVPWCPRCGTALSSHELAQGYEDVKDLSVYVKFRIRSGEKNLAALPSLRGLRHDLDFSLPTFFLAWTTTPWTLPGNVALAVGEDIDYVGVKVGNENYILAKERLSLLETHELIAELKGKDLVGLEYEPLFPFLEETISESEKPKLKNAYKVYPASFVNTEDGTGIVHTAVMYGQDDFVLGTIVDLPKHHLLNPEGKFIKGTGFIENRFVRETDEAGKPTLAVDIIKYLTDKNLFLKKENYEHSYPHCWRCHTPLIYYARDSWYVEMSDPAVKQKLVAENKEINWEPSHIREGRFGEWLREVKDWAISRERYWGTPLPVWACTKCGKKQVAGSLQDLKKRAKKSNNKYFIMRHGEAENNAQKIYSSDREKNNLTEEGRAQVLKTAELVKNKKVTKIFSSPFLRTRETAELVAEKMGFPKEKIVYDDRLRELEFGEFSERPVTDFWNYVENHTWVFDSKIPGGESYQDAKNRLAEFLYEIDAKLQDETVLIISHGLAVEMIPAIIEGADKIRSLEIFHTLVNNKPAVLHKEHEFVPLPHNENYELDLHRPYIDEIKLVCECGGEQVRNKEVLDVWLDSGCMPFAQDHYPFENKDWVDGPGYPADYICEAIDQTRGWFYTLHAVGILMGRGKAYKNVICLGHLLDAKGKKMSKSLGNVVEPFEAMDKYGVDTLRLWMYSVNQPGESKNFDEKTVQLLGQQVFGLLYNVLFFYELYRDESLEGNARPKSENVLDIWILSRLDELTEYMTRYLDSYKLLESTRALRDFIGDLSTWYLRRSRERIKDNNKEAKQTLYFVLKTLAKLMAPLAPFAAEDIWLRIKNIGDRESVHLEDWPAKDVFGKIRFVLEKGKIKKVMIDMKTVRDLVSAGLKERQLRNIPVKQPLKGIKLKITLPKNFQSIIQEELNIKKIEEDKGLEGDISIDAELTPELKEEGNYRELVRTLQEMRKKLGLKPTETVALSVEASEEGKKLIEKFKTEIKKSVLISKVEFKPSDGEEIKIGDLVFRVKIDKIGG